MFFFSAYFSKWYLYYYIFSWYQHIRYVINCYNLENIINLCLNMPLIVTIIFLIINVIYGSKNKDTKLIINEIKKANSWFKYLLYFLYFIFIIPVFVDIVLVILDFIKKRRACF